MNSLQIVSFALSGDTYGADVLSIREVIFPQQVTKVPNNPPFIEGIIHYRDSVVPILDLRKRFNLGSVEESSQKRFIVVEMEENKFIGFIVDSVDEIFSVEQKNLSDAPKETKINKEYIKGVVTENNKLVILLDLKKILTITEKDILNSTIK